MMTTTSLGGEGPGKPSLAAPKSSSLTQQTISGLLWQFLGTGVELLIRIAVMIVLTRLLAPAEFGVVAAALILVNFTKIIAQLGIAQSIVQLPDLTEEEVRTGFAFSTWLGVVLAAAVYLGAAPLAAIFKIAGLEPVIAAFSVSFLLGGPAIVPFALLQRRRRYRAIAGIEALSFALGLGALGVTLAFLGFGVWALVVGQLAQIAIRSVMLLAAERHPKALLVRPSSLSRLLASGVGFSIGVFGNSVAMNADNFTVGRWMGAQDLGLYSRAYNFLMLPTNLFGTVVDKVLFPAMAHVQDDAQRLNRAFRRSLAVVAMITLPVSVVLTVLAPELVTVVLGRRWVDMVLPFQVLAATMLFRTSYKMSDSLARAKGAVYRRAWRQWLYAAAVFVGALIGTHWGLGGVATGVGLAIVLNFVLMLDLSLRITGLGWGAVLALHLRFLLVAAAVLAATWAAAAWARSQALHPLLVLGLGGAAALAVQAVMVAIGRPAFGAEGEWVLDAVRERLGSARRKLGLRLRR
ncbi:MAG: polysaccharide biosynthesis protein [Phenylobacterium sp.]|nr:polysaccharide biosynthesis protein [Phenylobacterium sp.]